MQRTHVPSWFSDILPLEPRCEPAYDLQLLRRLIVANDVPLHQWLGVSAWSLVCMILDKFACEVSLAYNYHVMT